MNLVIVIDHHCSKRLTIFFGFSLKSINCINIFWSEQSACNALGHRRQNKVAAINRVISLSSYSEVFTFLQEGVVLGFRNLVWVPN